MNTRKEVYELTPLQYCMWRDQVNNRDNPKYNGGGYIDIQGAIDPSILEKTLQKVISVNDALRIIIDENGNQRIVNEYLYRLKYFDFINKSDIEIHEYMNTLFKQPLEISNAFLYEFQLLKISENRFFFYACFHHVLFDAWSCSLIFKQIIDYYSIYSAQKYLVPLKTISYKTYVSDAVRYKLSSKYRDDKKYWLSYLRDFKFIPLDSTYSFLYTRSKRKVLSIHRKDMDRIRKQMKTIKNSEVHFFLAAIFLSINKIFGVEDLIMGFAILNRNRFKEKFMVGLFDNIIPLRLPIYSIGKDMKVISSYLRKQLMKSYHHGGYSFCELYGTDQVSIDKLFEVTVSYVKSDFSTPFLDYEYKVETLSSYSEPTSLTFIINDTNPSQDVKIYIEYKDVIFNNGKTIEQFLKCLCRYLRNMD